jgi:hypothetical protein
MALDDLTRSSVVERVVVLEQPDVSLSGTSQADIAAMKADIALIKAGIPVSAALPAGTNNIGDVDVATLPGTVQADIAAMKADIALIKAQNQTVKPAIHSLVFDEDDLVKTSAIAYNGPVKHLHLVLPNFTNVVTATVTLVDASGRVLWTSAAKAKNASYNLEVDVATTWADQLVDSTMLWTVTLSGAAGGAGGTVVLVPRYYGV